VIHSKINPGLDPMTSLAWQLAETAHQGQFRDRSINVPYFTHCIEVFTHLAAVGEIIDPVLLSAGLLHDSLEETGLEPDQISSEIGSQVLELVNEVTRSEPLPEALEVLNKDQVYELRTKILIEEIAKMSAPAQTIKLADRLSNLRFGRWTRTEKNFARYCKQTQLLLDTIPPKANFQLHRELSNELAHCANNAGRQTNSLSNALKK